jgi:nucleoside-diphosphate-sugar epimerase
MKVAIIGLGWYGLPLGLSLSAEAEVTGTKSTVEGVAEAKAMGIAATLISLHPALKIEQPELIAGADCAVVNLPPGRSSGGNVDQYISIIQSLTETLAKGRVHHLVFVTSTGVFGEHQHIVDETTTPEPTTESGHALAESENWLRNTWTGRLSVLRPAGLVGEARHTGRFLAGNHRR